MQHTESSEEEATLLDITLFTKEELCLGVLLALGTFCFLLGVFVLGLHLFII